jgi:hypothetical protein
MSGEGFDRKETNERAPVGLQTLFVPRSTLLFHSYIGLESCTLNRSIKELWDLIVDAVKHMAQQYADQYEGRSHGGQSTGTGHDCCEILAAHLDFDLLCRQCCRGLF